MRCRHCSIRFSKGLTIPPFRASCPKCARIAGPILVSSQGDGVSSFREVMIRQNSDDHSRKLLETRSYHFIVFLDERFGIVGFDLEDRDSAHLFQWRKGRKPRFYGVANLGSGYHNRDEVFLNGRFQSAEAIAELKACGRNILGDVRATLVEGINAYESGET